MSQGISRSELVSLSAKIVAEAKRRNGYGSLAEKYGIDSYKITATPSVGSVVSVTDGNKIIEPLINIKDYGDLKRVVKGELIPDSFASELSSYVDTLAKESMTGSSTSCRGACTGLCVGTCHTECSGCSSGCSGCSDTCNTSCQATCTGTCGSGCASGAMVSKGQT